jgi:PhzF family phenazine biosynthesis protein
MRVEAGPEPAASRSRRGEGSGRLIFVQAPRARFVHDFSTSLDAISAALGARVSDTPPPASVDNGPAWLFCRFDDPATIAGLTPDMTAVARLSRDFGVTGFVPFAFTPAHPEEAPGRAGVGESAVSKDHAVHIRAFAPAVGVPEDPVTGSANASLPTYLARHNLLERTGREYVASQGTELGRDGRVHVRVLDDDGFAEVGGQAVTVIEGEIRL